MTIKFLFLLLSLSLAKEVQWNSGSKQINVVELYSSEGCSSCPPAEKWMTSLRTDKSLWKSFVPVEFHVDYWNQLGWVDPFSNKQFTRRQWKYAKEWGNSKVYTPGFAFNGKEWRSRSLKQIIAVGPEVGELKVSDRGKDRYLVKFTPTKKGDGNYRVFAMLLGNGLETKVPAGENAGRKLKHDFVVLFMNQKSLKNQKGIYQTTIDVPKRTRVKAKSLSLAFWVTDKSSLKPIQAVGGDLP